MKNTTLVLVLISLYACNSHKLPRHHSKEAIGEEASVDNNTAKGVLPVNCDTSTWKYVYDRDRLEVLDYCKTVTGTITERNADPDGDEHMLLKLDKGGDHLLKKRNYKKKEGCLVVEVVCVNNITRKRAKGACTGYANNVWLPAVGDHVVVTGSYVLDSHNGWTEIHPAWDIKKTK